MCWAHKHTDRLLDQPLHNARRQRRVHTHKRVTHSPGLPGLSSLQGWSPDARPEHRPMQTTTLLDDVSRSRRPHGTWPVVVKKYEHNDADIEVFTPASVISGWVELSHLHVARQPSARATPCQLIHVGLRHETIHRLHHSPHRSTSTIYTCFSSQKPPKIISRRHVGLYPPFTLARWPVTLYVVVVDVL